MRHTGPYGPRAARFVRVLVLGMGTACLIFGAFLIAIGYVNNRFFDALNRDIAPPGTPAEERALLTFARVSAWEYFDAGRIASPVLRWLARAEHASPLHLSARSALTAGADRIGPCGSLSRSMVVLLRRAGIPTRKVILYSAAGRPEHTVVEVLLDAEWCVFDPTYAWYWRRPADGRIATAADLARDPRLFASVRERHPGYPLDRYVYDSVQHLRWEKLPGLPWVRGLLARAFGPEWVSSIHAPYLYERPTFFVGLLATATGGLFFGVAGWMRRPRRPRGPTHSIRSVAGPAGARGV